MTNRKAFFDSEVLGPLSSATGEQLTLQEPSRVASSGQHLPQLEALQLAQQEPSRVASASQHLPQLEALQFAPREASRVASTSQHLPQLEPLRGVAILLVITFHSTAFTMDKSLRFARNLDGLFYRMTSFGWVGVDLFFVLSGFLITRILLRSKGRTNYLRNFYARRILRIFPLYYAAVVLWLVVTRLGYSRSFGAGPWLLTYTSNLLMAWRGWDSTPISVGHFWSLAVEEQFYLVWPFLVYLCTKRSLLRVCGAMLLVSAVSRIGFVAVGNDAAPYTFPLCRADSLLAGSAIALYLGYEDVPNARLVATARRVLFYSGGVLALLAIYRGGQFDLKDPWVHSLGMTPLLLFMASILVLVLVKPGVQMAHMSHLSRALSTIGKYSYGVYVFQQPVLLTLGRLQPRLVNGSHHLLNQLLMMAVGTSISLGLSLISWHALERHAIALKRYFL